MKIAIGGDHAGFDYKGAIIEMLKEQGVEVEDFGPFSNESCDYPDFVHPVAEAVEGDDADLGIVITASHNPPSYNGYKLKGSFGGPLLQQDITDIENRIPDSFQFDLDTILISALSTNKFTTPNVSSVDSLSTTIISGSFR